MRLAPCRIILLLFLHYTWLLPNGIRLLLHVASTLKDLVFAVFTLHLTLTLHNTFPAHFSMHGDNIMQNPYPAVFTFHMDFI